MQPRSSFSASVLPFALLLLASHCVARAASATQCTGRAAGRGFDWWLTKNTSNPMNPCQVYQKLMRKCQPNYTVSLMGKSALDVGDICDENILGYSARCCCSTEAYALRQACWSCQNGGQECEDDRSPTLREYIRCSQNLENWDEVYTKINMPTWARFGIPLDAHWLIGVAKQITKTPLNMVAQGDPDDIQQFEPEHGIDKSIIIASVTGSLFGLLFVAGIAACVFIIRRRRRRAKTRHSHAPPRWFMQNFAYDGGSAGSTEESHTMVESASIPPKPPPSLGRGRIGSHPNASTASGGSWWSSFAREPYLPRAGNTLESRDYARNYSASRSEVTVSMIRSETEGSRISLDSDHTIDSFSNSPHRQSTIASRAASRVTHAFSV